MAQADAPGYREALEKTLQDADALLATFNALLDIARLEGAADAGPSDRIDLADIAADVGELYDPVAEDANITLMARAHMGEAVVYGDRRLLAQALANLVDNAIKYTPSGGEVRIAAANEGEDAALIVSDNGPGVPSVERARIFDRFYRLDNPITRQERGAGLGLSVCRNMVMAHGGRIWVTSEIGKGSTFFIAFPRNEGQEVKPSQVEVVAA